VFYRNLTPEGRLAAAVLEGAARDSDPTQRPRRP
jgi:hypothetical protein